MSRLGYSLRAFSSQKVPCEPPSNVLAWGCTSLAIVISFIADLYSKVVAVTPIRSDGVLEIRSLNPSYVSFSAWQSITMTRWPAFSQTAPKYAMPSGINGGCEWTLGGYGGLTKVIFMSVALTIDF
jgi:hypothetical protein